MHPHVCVPSFRKIQYSPRPNTCRVRPSVFLKSVCVCTSSRATVMCCLARPVFSEINNQVLKRQQDKLNGEFCTPDHCLATEASTGSTAAPPQGDLVTHGPIQNQRAKRERQPRSKGNPDLARGSPAEQDTQPFHQSSASTIQTRAVQDLATYMYLKLSKIQSSVPRTHQLHCGCSIAIRSRDTAQQSSNGTLPSSWGILPHGADPKHSIHDPIIPGGFGLQASVHTPM